jgi:hypothetical protein
MFFYVFLPLFQEYKGNLHTSTPLPPVIACNLAFSLSKLSYLELGLGLLVILLILLLIEYKSGLRVPVRNSLSSDENIF